MSMTYYPIFLNLSGKKVLVVGGGQVAERKIKSLLECEASVSVVSKDTTPEVREMIDDGRVHYLDAEFARRHLSEVFLVIAATDDERLNRQISEAARRQGKMINVVDQPEDCDFILPSVVKKGDLSIAISTSGKSPALAKKIRKELEAQFGREYELFLVLMGRLRGPVLSTGLSQSANSRIFHGIVESEILGALAKGDWQKVGDILRRILPKEISVEMILDGFHRDRGG
jgi:precorrin-2 dehydrogenase/sirohydrochlorin ferrochelatase